MARAGVDDRAGRATISRIGASDLALPAARAALEQAGREAKDVDAILFATLSPDVNFPGSGCFLAHKLGLPGVPALDVRNQCSGFLYSLSVADAWVRAGVYRTILVVGAEVHSTGLDFTERGRDIAVLFGDGAGAVVVGESPDDKAGILAIELHADGVGARDLWLEAPASMYMPRLTHEMIDDGRVWPRMNGKAVFRWATDKMPEVAKSVLGKVGWSARPRPVRAPPGQHAHQPDGGLAPRDPRREDCPQHRALRQSRRARAC